jgi:hypothetical protein
MVKAMPFLYQKDAFAGRAAQRQAAEHIRAGKYRVRFQS